MMSGNAQFIDNAGQSILCPFKLIKLLFLVLYQEDLLLLQCILECTRCYNGWFLKSKEIKLGAAIYLKWCMTFDCINPIITTQRTFAGCMTSSSTRSHFICFEWWKWWWWGGVGTKVSYAWTYVSRNSTHHTHYVQGVAYDPLGVYVASQGSDRTVGVWSRKKNAAAGGGGGGGGAQKDTKKKVLGSKDKNQTANRTSTSTRALVVA